MPSKRWHIWSQSLQVYEGEAFSAPLRDALCVPPLSTQHRRQQLHSDRVFTSDEGISSTIAQKREASGVQMSQLSVPEASARIERLFDTRRYAEIIDLCSEIVSAYADEWKFYYHRAQAKMLLRRRSEAIDDLTSALKIQDREPALYYFRGSWNVDSGNDLEGSDDLMHAIDAEVELGTAYYVESARFRRAIAFLHLGEFEKAHGECRLVRPDLRTWVKGRLWSATEVLDRAKRRVRP